MSALVLASYNPEGYSGMLLSPKFVDDLYLIVIRSCQMEISHLLAAIVLFAAIAWHPLEMLYSIVFLFLVGKFVIWWFGWKD